MKHRKLVAMLLCLVIAGLIVPSVLGAAPGASPADPLRVTNAWQSLAPNSSVWFYFDYTGDRSAIEVTLEDYGVPNVRLAIFTPDQARNWLQDPATQPIGIGMPPGDATAMRQYDLTWRGAFNFPGRFFVVVTNANPYAIQFRLNVKGDAVQLAPPPTATPVPTPFFATPVPTGNLQGRFVLQESSGGNIYTVNGDGTNLKRITWGIDPSWSPDGKQIAFTRWGTQAGVYVINADGSNERALVGGMRQPLSPRWNPNGTKIAYTRQWGGSETDTLFCLGRFCFTLAADPHWRLSTVDVNTQIIFDPRSSAHAFAPAWKNDNVTLVYADAGYGLMITNINGDPEWNIYKQNPVVQTPMYSPDGKMIAFTVRAHDHWDINVLDLTNGNVIPVTHADPMAFRPANNVSPVWSPDGKQILFLSDRNGKWEFFVANADGTNLTQVLKNVSDTLALNYNFSNERMIDWLK
jgi:TolB protein